MAAVGNDVIRERPKDSIDRCHSRSVEVAGMVARGCVGGELEVGRDCDEL